MLEALLENLNYGTIFFLMLLESTIVPVPSELVVAPAAYHAAAGSLSFWLVVLMATAGACVGASINYLAGKYVGRVAIYRFAESRLGRMCLLSESKIRKSEQYFNDHGMAATITGRLIPGIRHLISIPAGMAVMNYPRFLLYTAIGAGAWHTILASLGYYLHSFVPESELSAKVEEYGHMITIGIVAVVAVAFAAALALAMVRRRSRRSAAQGSVNGN